MERMDYQTFCERLIKEITKYLPEEFAEAEPLIEHMEKDNGRIEDALCIKRYKCEIVPAIYLRDVYEAYEAGDNYENVMTRVAMTHLRGLMTAGNMDLEFVRQYESSKERIQPRVIGTKRNSQYLEDRPHRETLDLSIVYELMLNEDQGRQVIVINNDMLTMWNRTEEDLYEAAMENIGTTEKCTARRMKDMIKELVKDVGAQENFDWFDANDDIGEKIWVVTNSKRYYGAKGILDTKLMDELADTIGDGFFILPSSVHEVLVIPRSAGLEEDAYEQIVKQNNASPDVIDDDEIMTDSVYTYYKGKGLQMAGDGKKC
jgi:hypothetical protein